ncbi:metallophosphoesterase [Gynuella sunshinyii]|uniref:metallophosphoesterase n=1 Tax=Gynuella sunshinyii TaxID=1445505 RepID=UPI000B0D14D7|nr:metallophosphoesterase [Gynuella sunshinyii]
MSTLSYRKWLAPLSFAVLLSACGADDSSNSTSDADQNQDGSAVAAKASYTIAVLPDTQKYARYSPERYNAQTQWIADNYKDEGIVFTLHLGDVVDRADQPAEWQYARQAMEILEANAETPYSILAGNHDVMNAGQ